MATATITLANIETETGTAINENWLTGESRPSPYQDLYVRLTPGSRAKLQSAGLALAAVAIAMSRGEEARWEFGGGTYGWTAYVGEREVKPIYGERLTLRGFELT